MPAPPRYMRFYPAAYAKATIKMSMEEQGTYMRLLCLMWANGGSIENDDSYIAKALPINLNKWLKVKHKILPFLSDGEPGYLTQEKLVEEYQYVSRKTPGSKADEHAPTPGNSFMDASSMGGKPGNSLDESAADPYAAPRTVHPAASPTAPRAAPPTDYFAGQRAASLAIEVLPIGTIIPYARNPRRNEHAVAKVAGSIKEFGFRQPIVVDKELVIIVGHTRLLAAQQLGFTHVPVHVAENLSPSQIKAYRIADNRTNEEAEWDEEMLAIELGDLKDADFDLDLTGFDPDELEELLAGDGTEGLTDDDDVPEVQAIAISKPGDVWLCGDHRVLCGDSTIGTDVEKAMNGSLADMVFTDPPYNVNYASPNEALSGKKKIQNDNLGEGFYQFLYDAMVNLLAYTKGAIYISMSSSELHTLQKAFRDAGGHWSTFIMWAKNTFSLGRSDYHRQYEPILYGWKEGNKHFWCGARDQGDVWFFNKPRSNDLHPTMKPVELVQRAIENSSKTRDIILDLFGGSGTTMIAAEKTNRTAVLLELDPIYCDVIVRRWEQFTGRKATLESTGESFPPTEKTND